jgi:hypothetical protein
MNPLLVILGTAGIFLAAFWLATMAWMKVLDYFEALIPSCRWDYGSAAALLVASRAGCLSIWRVAWVRVAALSFTRQISGAPQSVGLGGCVLSGD